MSGNTRHDAAKFQQQRQDNQQDSQQKDTSQGSSDPAAQLRNENIPGYKNLHFGQGGAPMSDYPTGAGLSDGQPTGKGPSALGGPGYGEK